MKDHSTAAIVSNSRLHTSTVCSIGSIWHRLRKLGICLVIFGLLLLVLPGCPEAQQPAGGGGRPGVGNTSGDRELIEKYPRVMEIFAKVLAAADIPGRTSPRLELVQSIAMENTPAAWSMADGVVKVNKPALEACYSLGADKGDACLAQLLGHELAHLVRLDHLVETIGEDRQKFADSSGTADEAQKSTSIQEDYARARELYADAQGFLCALMAGYVISDADINPILEAVLLEDRSSGGYPSRTERIDSLKYSLLSAKVAFEAFTLGSRCYQGGKYEQALEFLEASNRRMPSKETLNNLGLVHYQLAMKALGRCNPGKAYRFKLATALDTTHPMDAIRGPGGEACTQYDNEEIQGHLEESIRCFRKACSRDARYLPARVNLSSALIIREDYHGAISAAREAVELCSGDPGALNNRAVALYLAATSPPLADMLPELAESAGRSRIAKNIIAGMEKDIEKTGATSKAIVACASYNLGSLLSEMTGEGDVYQERAQKWWTAFLDLEQGGEYASRARRKLGIPDPDRSLAACPALDPPPLPVVGTWEPAGTWKERKCAVKAYYLYCAEDSWDSKALVQLDEQDSLRVVWVEKAVLPSYDQGQTRAHGLDDNEYGSALLVSQLPAGMKTYVYDGSILQREKCPYETREKARCGRFALDVDASGAVKKVVYFSENQPDR